MPERSMTRAEWRAWWSAHRTAAHSQVPNWAGYPLWSLRGYTRSAAVLYLNATAWWRLAGELETARKRLGWAVADRESMGV